MPTCTRCRQDIGFFASIGFNKQTGRRAKCEQATHQALDRFRQNFLYATCSQLLSEESWQSLSRSTEADALDIGEVDNGRALKDQESRTRSETPRGIFG